MLAQELPLSTVLCTINTKKAPPAPESGGTEIEAFQNQTREARFQLTPRRALADYKMDNSYGGGTIKPRIVPTTISASDISFAA
jgi:hypothetical protein